MAFRKKKEVLRAHNKEEQVGNRITKLFTDTKTKKKVAPMSSNDPGIPERMLRRYS